MKLLSCLLMLIIPIAISAKELKLFHFFQAAYQGYIDNLKKYINKHPYTWKTAIDPRTSLTALMLAAVNDRPEVVRILIDSGAHTDVQDAKTKMTAVGYAVREGSTNALEVLLEAKANLEIPDRNGYTPLVLAATGSRGRRGNIEAVKILLEHGATPSLEIHRCRIINFCAQTDPSIAQLIADYAQRK